MKALYYLSQVGFMNFDQSTVTNVIRDLTSYQVAVIKEWTLLDGHRT